MESKEDAVDVTIDIKLVDIPENLAIYVVGEKNKEAGIEGKEVPKGHVWCGKLWTLSKG